VFERYTEDARRTLFFSRYESSALGSTSIETEHLLLGLLREPKGLTARVLTLANASPESMRKAAEARSVFMRPLATSVEIPFSEEVKRALHRAATEADQLQQAYIAPEHLLLALLHEPTTVAGSVLSAHGLEHDRVRKEIVLLLNGQAGLADSPSPPRTPRLQTMALEQIKRDVSRLAALAGASESGGEANALAEQIHRALDLLKPPPNS
jgi:ATP-dependent Clp protease ATP-binding subunit ClpC